MSSVPEICTAIDIEERENENAARIDYESYRAGIKGVNVDDNDEWSMRARLVPRISQFQDFVKIISENYYHDKERI